MIRVRVSTSFPELPIIRQTRHASGRWGDFQFEINGTGDQCDYWVVFEGPLRPESATCRRDAVVFISGEPPSLVNYPAPFLDQFGAIVTCHQRRHRNLIRTQQGLPWHLGAAHDYLRDRPGVLTYDDFLELEPTKTRMLSVVSSSKTLTRGHRDRFEFVKKLSNRLGERVDVFGRGIREITDKWEAIIPYRYHVAIENSSVPDYWTEKLSDALLGLSFPFYSGCPNIADYFPPGSMELIDIHRPDEAIARIVKTIENKTYEQAVDRLREARDLVLNEHNVFAMLARVLPTLEVSDKWERIELRPRKEFESVVWRVAHRIAHRLPRRIKWIFR
jgi:hypothetical protein